MKLRGINALVIAALALGIPLSVTYQGTAQAASAPLIIVMMENHGYSQVIGNAKMPYFNTVWNEGKNKTGPVTDYLQMYAVSHPSLPNYLAIASGYTQRKSGTDGITAGQIAARSLWDQLTAAGVSWKVFAEGMPSACFSGVTYNSSATNGEYALKHNPATPFAPVYTSAECRNVVPLSALNTSALPAVSFVTPNLCDDDHGLTSGNPFTNCVTGTPGLLTRGDAWLKSHLTAWTKAGADVLITWDEGGGTVQGGGQIAALMTGPGVTAGQNSTLFTHYSVLAGLEKKYGLARLGNAAAASPVPLP
jgi:phosphatidylinositol-3-phosphatase